jgi:hypothetical protein
MFANTKATTLVGLEKKEELVGHDGGARWWGKLPILPLRLAVVPSKYNRAGVHSYKCLEVEPA